MKKKEKSQLRAGKRLVIIDANSLVHRAFHALPPLTTKKGELVNAVYGFLLVLLRIIKEFRPDFAVACFDTKAPTFRHAQFKEYKAKRPPTSEDLSKQLPKVKEALNYFNIAICEKDGFEADDLIGALNKKFSGRRDNVSEIIIFSGDSDTLQLVGKETKVCLLRTGVKDLILYDKEKVKEKYGGLGPEQIVDFKALKGDISDNIPGVPGIGEKTAIELLLKFGGIGKLYKAIGKKTKNSENPKQRIREILLQNKDKAFLSRELAKIETDFSFEVNLRQLAWKSFDKKSLVDFLQRMEFHSLIKRIPEAEEKQETQATLGF